jgi:alkylation response protein AidB-like acyl-CoA dehydrogenase
MSLQSTAHDGVAQDSGLSAWLDANALSLDTSADLTAEVLPRLAEGGMIGSGIPKEFGGTGGDVTDGIAAISDVSERSLAAGFVLWGQRCYIEYLLQSPNAALRDRLLPDLLAGRLAGATGLSNAMKFLSGLEELQVNARDTSGNLMLDGKLPWVTNLRPQGFHVAVAVTGKGGRGSFIASLALGDRGVSRSADLDLMGMRASNTAAIAISGAEIDAERIIHPDALAWLPATRPAFLGLQCGMSIGLARRAIAAARAVEGSGRLTLSDAISDLEDALAKQEAALREGLRAATFKANPAALFRIRIALAEVVAQATGLELQASGGRAYLTAHNAGFARRWREAAFIPIITPSLVQLKAALTQPPNAA